MAQTIQTIAIPSQHMSNIFGGFDRYLKQIESYLHVAIIVRGDDTRIVGEPGPASRAVRVLSELLALSEKGEEITDQAVTYVLESGPDEEEEDLAHISDDIVCHTVNGKPVQPKTAGQKKYLDAIRNKMIVFGNGPAGTGKTYLAMAMAISAFQKEEVSRIILTRPAIEAGEKLGFLPGDLQSKIDPYLRPLYDALYMIMGAENFIRNQEKGLIEVAPLAYMRGRTLDNAFIILDEAQNTTPAQMKMFLTRIGFGSKVVITGDPSQKDLPNGQESGLDIALKVLKNVEDIGFCNLTSRDVVRHPLVQKIVRAYEEYETKQTKKNSGRKRS